MHMISKKSRKGTADIDLGLDLEEKLKHFAIRDVEEFWWKIGKV